MNRLNGLGSHNEMSAENLNSARSHAEHLFTDDARTCFALQTLYDLFKEFVFIWELDVTQTFEEFLQGRMSPNPGRTSSSAAASRLRRIASARSNTSRY